jgi:hypothetical protein
LVALHGLSLSLSSSVNIEAAVGGGIGCIVLLILIAHIYAMKLRKRRHDHIQDLEDFVEDPNVDVQGRNEVEKFAFTDDRTTSAASSYSAKLLPTLTNDWRSPAPPPRSINMNGLDHLSPTPLILPQMTQGYMTTASSGVSIPEPRGPVHPQFSTSGEEVQLIHHLHSLNVPTVDIAQMVESMRLERVRLADSKMGVRAVNQNEGGQVSSSQRINPDASPPEYDFRSE